MFFGERMPNLPQGELPVDREIFEETKKSVRSQELVEAEFVDLVRRQRMPERLKDRMELAKVPGSKLAERLGLEAGIVGELRTIDQRETELGFVFGTDIEGIRGDEYPKFELKNPLTYQITEYGSSGDGLLHAFYGKNQGINYPDRIIEAYGEELHPCSDLEEEKFKIVYLTRQ